jgi:hypothetical protein
MYIWITDITIEGYVTPWSRTDDRSKALIVCTKAEKDEIIVKVGDKQYSTKNIQEEHKVSEALNQILCHVLRKDYSGSLHNYKFAGGRAFNDEEGIEGMIVMNSDLISATNILRWQEHPPEPHTPEN